MAPERSVLESVIDELNQKLRDSHSVEFRTMGWGSLVPGVGPDAQAVINNQVGEDYDIYIGILGHRLGTQTPRAGSGTEEEFERAYQRWRNVPDTVRILFYFKVLQTCRFKSWTWRNSGKCKSSGGALVLRYFIRTSKQQTTSLNKFETICDN